MKKLLIIWPVFLALSNADISAQTPHNPYANPMHSWFSKLPKNPLTHGYRTVPLAAMNIVFGQPSIMNMVQQLTVAFKLLNKTGVWLGQKTISTQVGAEQAQQVVDWWGQEPLRPFFLEKKPAEQMETLSGVDPIITRDFFNSTVKKYNAGLKKHLKNPVAPAPHSHAITLEQYKRCTETDWLLPKSVKNRSEACGIAALETLNQIGEQSSKWQELSNKQSKDSLSGVTTQQQTAGNRSKSTAERWLKRLRILLEP